MLPKDWNVPVTNCLKCDQYSRCAEYEDGRCIIRTGETAPNNVYVNQKYYWKGSYLTAKEWASKLGLSYYCVQKQLKRNGTEGLERLLKNAVNLIIHNIVHQVLEYIIIVYYTKSPMPWK